MTLYEFNRLSEQDKYDVTFNEGTFVDYKVEAVIRFALYAIDMFFVEIEYNRVDNKILGLRSFKTGELLDKYSNL
ncbi:hypothetical protein NO995_11145 [Aestuariibaculum sp. M13]|uniref:hypothetical protein n=1 Tax=Aestuariibaculum sp. M13 TaxID=2967132 RepID=UPI00215A05A1|nr:hypothetical protein [Aestuariibaculum sp. M13]MCR8668242.1 hypothetical protein [Aestuariibaculum sp. M13]